MKSEADYIEYYENLATQHKCIVHDEADKSFFYVENPDDLEEFDEYLRTIKKRVAMLLVANNGEFNDNGSNNYTDELNAQVYIVIRKTGDKTIRELNNEAKIILRSVIARTRKDHPKEFRINKVPYTPVGPMCENWYGYTAMLTFICPFGFSVDSGTWLDK